MTATNNTNETAIEDSEKENNKSAMDARREMWEEVYELAKSEIIWGESSNSLEFFTRTAMFKFKLTRIDVNEKPNETL